MVKKALDRREVDSTMASSLREERCCERAWRKLRYDTTTLRSTFPGVPVGSFTLFAMEPRDGLLVSIKLDEKGILCQIYADGVNDFFHMEVHDLF